MSNETEFFIRNFLATTSAAAAKQLANALGFSSARIRKPINRLLASGCIEPIGSAHFGRRGRPSPVYQLTARGLAGTGLAMAPLPAQRKPDHQRREADKKSARASPSIQTDTVIKALLRAHYYAAHHQELYCFKRFYEQVDYFEHAGESWPWQGPIPESIRARSDRMLGEVGPRPVGALVGERTMPQGTVVEVVLPVTHVHEALRLLADDGKRFKWTQQTDTYRFSVIYPEALSPIMDELSAYRTDYKHPLKDERRTFAEWQATLKNFYTPEVIGIRRWIEYTLARKAEKQHEEIEKAKKKPGHTQASLDALARQHRIERFSLPQVVLARSLHPQWLSAGVIRLGALIQALDTSEDAAEAQECKETESDTRQEAAEQQASEQADENTTQVPSHPEAVKTTVETSLAKES